MTKPSKMTKKPEDDQPFTQGYLTIFRDLGNETRVLLADG